MTAILIILSILFAPPAFADLSSFTVPMICVLGSCQADLPPFEYNEAGGSIQYLDENGTLRGSWALNGLTAGGPTAIVVVETSPEMISNMKANNKYIWIEDIIVTTPVEILPIEEEMSSLIKNSKIGKIEPTWTKQDFSFSDIINLNAWSIKGKTQDDLDNIDLTNDESRIKGLVEFHGMTMVDYNSCKSR
jgi:hypothetical protein